MALLSDKNNKLLVEIGLDQSSLTNALTGFGKAIRAELKKAVREFTADKVFGGAGIDLKINGAATKREFERVTKGLTIRRPLLLDLKVAKEQIEKFQAGLRPLELGVRAVEAPKKKPTTPEEAGLDENRIASLNLQSLEATGAQLEQLRTKLIKLGFTEGEAKERLKELNAEYLKAVGVFQKVNRERDALRDLTGDDTLGFTPAQVTRLAEGAKLLENVQRQLGTNVRFTKAINEANTSFATLTTRLGEARAALQKDGAALATLQGALAKAGVPLLQVERLTKSFSEALTINKVKLDQWEAELKDDPAIIKKLTTEMNALFVAIDRTGRRIEAVDVGAVATSQRAIEANTFFRNIGFNLGLLSYGFENLGRQLVNTSRIIFNAIEAVARLADPLQRIKNLLAQDPTKSVAEQNWVVAQIRQIADLPGSDLEATAKAFRALNSLGLETASTLQLVRGLSKATARSGVGPEGIAEVAKQLREFTSSGKIGTKDIKNIVEKGGVDVADIINNAFGSLSAAEIEKAGPIKFIQALREGLTRVQDPIPTTLDYLNRLKNNLVDLALIVGNVLNPALNAANILISERIMPGLKALGAQFDQLSPNVKNFISYLLLSIPLIIGALGGLLLAIGTILKIALVGIKVFQGYEFLLTKFGSAATTATEALTGAGAATTAVAEGATTAATATGALGRALGVLSKVAGPLAIILTVLLALITNAGGAQDKFLLGIDRVTKSFSNLYASIQKLFGTKGITYLWGTLKLGLVTLGALSDILSGAIGSALQLLLDQVAAFINLIADFFAIFSANSFGEFLEKLVLSGINYFKRMIASFNDFAINLIDTTVKAIGPILEKLGVLDAGATERYVALLKRQSDEFRKYVTVAGDATTANVALAESNNNVATSAQSTKEAILEQKLAIADLADEADKAEKALLRLETQNRRSATRESLDAIKTSLQELGQSFGNDLNNLYTAGATNAALATLTTNVNAKRQQAMDRIKQDVGDALKEMFTALEDDTFFQKFKVQFGNLVDVQNIFAATDVKSLQKAIKGYRETLARALSDGQPFGPITDEGKKILIQFERQISQRLAAITNSANSQIADIDTLSRRIVSAATEAAERRTEAVRTEFQQLDNDLDLENKRKEVEKKRDEIQIIKDREVENLLTRTKARQLILKKEKDIAQAEFELDKLKLQREAASFPEGSPQRRAKEDELRLRFDRLQETLKRLTSTADKELSADGETAASRALERIAKGAKETKDAIDPVADRLFNLIALLTLDGPSAEFKQGIDALSTEFSILTKYIPQLGGVLKALSAGDVGGIAQAFKIFEAAPAAAQLNTIVTQLRERIQAVILSEVNPDNSDVISKDAFSPLLLKLLGLGNTDQTRLAVREAIEKLDLEQIVSAAIADPTNPNQNKGLLAILGNLPLESEEIKGLVTQALALHAEITKAYSAANNEFTTRVDESVLAIQRRRIETRIAQNAAIIAKIDADNQSKVIATELDTKRKLLVENIKYQFQIDILEEAARARTLARATSVEAEKTRILEESLQRRLKIEQDAEAAITGITGAPANLDQPTAAGGARRRGAITGLPVIDPDLLKEGTSVFKELKRNLGDTSEIKTAAQALGRLQEALDKTFASARQAREGVVGLFNELASGNYFLDTFTAAMEGAASMTDVAAAAFATGFAMIGKALADTLVDVLVNGGSFLDSLGKFFGQMLIALGTQLIQLGTAAVVLGLLSKIPFFAFLDPGGLSIAGGAIAIATGAALVAAGAAMGGGGGASKAASTSTSGAANSSTGASNKPVYDPTKDPKTMYQKQMMANIIIDIRHDDGMIVKKVIKAVNSNGRLANLIGNRKLGFGY